MTTNYTATLAEGHGRKVHLAFGFQNGAPSCDRGERVIRALVDIDPDGGLAETVAAIVEAGIPARRLCAYCFAIRTRKAVAAGPPSTAPLLGLRGSPA